VTPIQLVRMIAAVANGGDLVQPHLLKNFAAKTDHFPLAEDTVEQVTQGMYGVINEGGTGASLKLANIEFSGKSGTAQLMSYEAGNKMGKKGKETNGWFVGYAPRRNPEIVVAAVIQGSSEHGGTTAGPVVRDLVKAYYDKKRSAVYGEGRTARVSAGIQKRLSHGANERWPGHSPAGET
jgi:penicillin-binding protein 2